MKEFCTGSFRVYITTDLLEHGIDLQEAYTNYDVRPNADDSPAHANTNGAAVQISASTTVAILTKRGPNSRRKVWNFLSHPSACFYQPHKHAPSRLLTWTAHL